jgi:hypothetical protein
MEVADLTLEPLPVLLLARTLLSGPIQQLFQLAPIQPDTPTLGAHIDLDAGSAHILHRGVAVGA